MAPGRNRVLGLLLNKFGLGPFMNVVRDGITEVVAPGMAAGKSSRSCTAHHLLFRCLGCASNYMEMIISIGLSHTWIDSLPKNASFRKEDLQIFVFTSR